MGAVAERNHRTDPRKPVPLHASQFGVRLRELRVRVDLSQNALAKLAGIDPGYVNRLERCAPGGTHTPSRGVILALSEVLELHAFERDELLVIAGLCPEAILQAGGWSAYLDRVRAAVDGALNVLEKGEP
jgi:transcriptional regulator with XRE-family HTH domain